MKKYTLAVLFCGTFTFCSCSGFLDEVPKGQITTESYYRTEQHAISATNAIYNYLIMGYSPGGLWDKNYGGVFYNDYWVLQDLFSDNANSQQANIQYTSVDNMQIDQYNEPVELLWRDFYQTIKCCNVVIDKVPAIDMDDILKKHLIAEAKFFRGMMYFDLIRMFGDVPLREHNLESADHVDDIADVLLSQRLPPGGQGQHGLHRFGGVHHVLRLATDPQLAVPVGHRHIKFLFQQADVLVKGAENIDCLLHPLNADPLFHAITPKSYPDAPSGSFAV